jgi:hypothetical protein
MDPLKESLESFLPGVGLGSAVGRMSLNRAELVTRLERLTADTKRRAWIWTGMMVVVFGSTLFLLLKQMATPEVLLPTSGVTLASMLWKVERVWRDSERFSIVLQIALFEKDEALLRELFVRVLNALFPEKRVARTTDATSSV